MQVARPFYSSTFLGAPKSKKHSLSILAIKDRLFNGQSRSLRSFVSSDTSKNKHRDSINRHGKASPQKLDYQLSNKDVNLAGGEPSSRSTIMDNTSLQTAIDLTTYNAQGPARPSLHGQSATYDIATPRPKNRLRGVTRSALADNTQEYIPRRTHKRNRTQRTPHVSSIPLQTDEHLVDKVLQLPPSIYHKRSTTLDRVQKAIQARYGAKYKVELFGSVRYGISLPTSDLDMVVIDPDRPQGIVPQEEKSGLPSIYNIRRLGHVMRRAGFIRIIAIPTASVPIIKFTDPVTGLDCDININEQLSLSNSDLIKAYCDMSLDLRRMLAFIKLWGKPLGLNNPSPQRAGEPLTFSSYAIALMTIWFLQKRGLLPNLQENLPLLPSGSEEGKFWAHRPGFLCDTRFQIRNDWKAPAGSPLRGLMEQWFRYWREFNYDKQQICIRTGGLVEQPLVASWPVMCIVDPFIWNKNVTRSLRPIGLTLFLHKCEQALEALDSGKLLDELVLHPFRESNREPL